MEDKKLIKINGDNRLMSFDEVVAQYKNFLYKEVYKFSYKVNYDTDELHQLALIALWKAYKTYNHETLNQFLTYAATVIRNEILMHLRKIKRIAEMDIVSLDAPIANSKNEGDKISVIDTIADKTNVENTVVEDSNFKDKMEIFKKILKIEELKILKLIQSGVTSQKEIGEELGFSQSYISRIIKRLTQKIGPAVEEYYIGKINWSELIGRLHKRDHVRIKGGIPVQESTKNNRPDKTDVIFNKEISLGCNWLLDHPGEMLDLGKLLKDIGTQVTPYQKAKLYNKIMIRMKDEGYNIQEVIHGKGSKLQLIEQYEQEDISEPIVPIVEQIKEPTPVTIIDVEKDVKILLNISDIPVSNIDLKFAEALQRSLVMFTLIGKSAVLDITVREVS